MGIDFLVSMHFVSRDVLPMNHNRPAILICRCFCRRLSAAPN